MSDVSKYTSATEEALGYAFLLPRPMHGLEDLKSNRADRRELEV